MLIESSCAFEFSGECGIGDRCADLVFLKKQGRISIDQLGLDPRLIRELDEKGWGVPILACAHRNNYRGSYLCRASSIYPANTCNYFVPVSQDISIWYPLMRRGECLQLKQVV